MFCEPEWKTSFQHKWIYGNNYEYEVIQWKPLALKNEQNSCFKTDLTFLEFFDAKHSRKKSCKE